MNQVVLLTTDWAADYWHKPKRAQFTGKVSYRDLPNWSDLADSCPLAGLGIYYKKKNDYSRRPFVYIQIKGMSYDSGTANPFFTFEVIQASSTSSDALRSRLPSENLALISTIQTDDLLRILREVGEQAPAEWLQLVAGKTAAKTPVSWCEYLGNYFLALEQGTLSDNEFEDRTAFLLKALGFKVTSKGHNIQGPYEDGIAFHEDIGIVYDCKNSQNFAPTEDDIRALKQYATDERTIHSDKTLYSAFISKDFLKPPQQDTFHLRIESLLYLLFIKLIKGSEFNLNPVKLILQKRRELDRKAIDEYWRP